MKFLLSSLFAFFAVSTAFADCKEHLATIQALSDQSRTQGFFEIKGGRVNYVAVYDEQLQSIRFENIKGRVPQGTEMIVPMFHGNGAMTSHSHAMLRAGHILSAESSKKGSIVGALRESPDNLRIATEIFDQPDHGLGPNSAIVPNLDAYMAYLHRYFTELKSYGLPIVPLGRSASTGILVEYNRRYPGVLSGLILMSPCHPTKGMDESFQMLISQATEQAEAFKTTGVPPKLVLNPKGIEFTKRMYAEFNWTDEKSLLRDLPVLVLTGGKDVETPEATRRAFAEMLTHPGSVFHNEPEAAHDVMAVQAGKDDQGIRVYQLIQSFLKKFSFPALAK